EIAVRLSIGATRSRLVRQLLTESLLLSIFGGLLGIGVAYWCDTVLPGWASGGSLPIPLDLAPDMRVLLFSIVVVLATGILFGLAPGFHDTNIRHYDHGQLLSFYQKALDRVQALPGVHSASLATCSIASNCRSASDIYLPGGTHLAATPQTNIVSLHYFDNVGIPRLRGRD